MIPGIEFAGIASGIKASGLDLGLIFFAEEMNVFALYTKNRVKAAHIKYNRKLDSVPARAILVNSGCANACTGKEGVSDLKAMAKELSPLLRVDPEKILFASTGVIGRRMPVDTIVRAFPLLVKHLKPANLDAFARAIMTTDTYPKAVEKTFSGAREYHVAGVAKGAGMINPLFATMLSFLFTDYPANRDAISRAFVTSVKESFERITVDGECSTNDTVMLFTRQGEDLTGLDAFQGTLASLLKELAAMVVRDGEGATRVIHIKVKGAKRKEDAEKVARRISISPLIKTAFFGCDPNWGRVFAATGDANVPVQPERINITMQGTLIVRGGVEVPFDEKAMKVLMDRKEVELIVDLGNGKAAFDIFTTDLTYGYIKINASYRS